MGLCAAPPKGPPSKAQARSESSPSWRRISGIQPAWEAVGVSVYKHSFDIRQMLVRIPVPPVTCHDRGGGGSESVMCCAVRVHTAVCVAESPPLPSRLRFIQVSPRMPSEAGAFWVRSDGQASSRLMQAASGQLGVKTPVGSRS